MTLTIGSLFSGIGGFELGAERAGLGPVLWQVEIDPECRHWLAEHWPDAIQHEDVHGVGAHNLARVNAIIGGFPCQPNSQAGKRLGRADPRWLWPEFARVVRELRPEYVLVENVTGLLTNRDERGCSLAGDVLGDLAALGYDAEWEVLSAADIGAPQERERLWIVAYASGLAGGGAARERADAGAGGWDDAARCGEGMVDSAGERLDTRSLGGTCAEAVSERERRGDAGDGRAPLVDASSGGRGAGEGLAVRRALGGREELGDAGRGRVQRLELEGGARGEHGAHEGEGVQRERRRRDTRAAGEFVGDAGRAGCEERLAPAEPVDEGHAAGERRRVGDWDDATPVRGADGTIRLIPREAAEQGPQSPLWPVADGIPGRVARLRAIGNAVVPACAEIQARVIVLLEALR